MANIYRSHASFCALAPSRVVNRVSLCSSRFVGRFQSTLSSPTSTIGNHDWKKTSASGQTAQPPLSIMPTSLLLRTLMATTLLSFPRLVSAFLPLLEKLSTTKFWLTNPDKNPVLKRIMKFTFYDNFAAGENEAEVRYTVDTLKKMGCHGVILGYARETMAGHTDGKRTIDAEYSRAQVALWKEGNLRTVGMVDETDFVGIKYTGAGEAVSRALMAGDDPPLEFRAAMEEIIESTIAKGARIVVDAEQQVYQHTIDAWTLNWMRKYNTPRYMNGGNPPIYNTMQGYLKSTPQRLMEHLKLAQEENFTLAFKLVRGAYITSETRSLIHDTKEDTDNAYNTIVRDLIQNSYPGVTEPFPSVKFVVAGHNEESVMRALATHNQEVAAGRSPACLEFGQIQGMADEVTCAIAQLSSKQTKGSRPDLTPKVYKALSWGTVQELMQNLIRRAVENRAAVERTKEWRSGLWKELRRRSLSAIR